jgi:hypothetical protein
MPVRTWRLLSGTVRELDVSDRVIGFYIDSDYVVMPKRRFASTRLSNGQRVIAAARRSMFIRSRWSVHGYRLADDQTIHTSGVGDKRWPGLLGLGWVFVCCYRAYLGVDLADALLPAPFGLLVFILTEDDFRAERYAATLLQ